MSKTAVVRKIHRDGDWWGQQPDGSWLRWNTRRNDWEFYPLAPPGEDGSASAPGRRANSLSADNSLLGDAVRVYGFLFIASVAVFFLVSATFGLVSRVGPAVGINAALPTARQLALDAPSFILIWVLFVGTGALVLRRTPERGWTLRMLVIGLGVSAAMTLSQWGLEPRWVEPSALNVLKGWAVLSMLGFVWHRQRFALPES